MPRRADSSFVSSSSPVVCQKPGTPFGTSPLVHLRMPFTAVRIRRVPRVVRRALADSAGSMTRREVTAPLSGWGLVARGFPVPEKACVHSGARRLGDACTHIGEPSAGVDVVELGGDDEGGRHRSPPGPEPAHPRARLPKASMESFRTPPVSEDVDTRPAHEARDGRFLRARAVVTPSERTSTAPCCRGPSGMSWRGRKRSVLPAIPPCMPGRSRRFRSFD